ncbi:MAG: PD40 domain-containing protein [Deltaproteobacteria bacterium]|nr:PD40 domain-containing protein [Deltaproteobacteria bacterium]
MRLRLAVLLLCGCGRMGFDTSADAAPDEAVPPDGPCVLGAFAPPVKLGGPVQSLGDDWFPTPTLGERELYFYRYTGGAGDGEVVRAARPDTSAEWGPASRVAEVGTAIDDTSVALSEDSLVLIMTRSGATTNMFEATRSAPGGAFSTPVRLTLFAAQADDLSPWLSSDGLRLTFGSRQNGLLDIFETTRATRAAPWGQPVFLSTLSSSGRDDNPTLSEDGLEVFFSSDRTGSASYDVYRSTRTALGQPFSAPQVVPELSSAGDDIGTRLSRDGRRMYFNFNSVRTGGQNAELWTSTRGCQ